MEMSLEVCMGLHRVEWTRKDITGREPSICKESGLTFVSMVRQHQEAQMAQFQDAWKEMRLAVGTVESLKVGVHIDTRQ